MDFLFCDANNNCQFHITKKCYQFQTFSMPALGAANIVLIYTFQLRDVVWKLRQTFCDAVENSI